jgi:TIR domain
MSHVFVSYAHDDKAHLDRLVAWLHDNGFSEHEIWYDQYIEGGNNWRDEIADALDEAFAVLVIVTATSVKSLHCTYEWAYAMGQGIATLPLTFDAVSIADVPTPLTSKQFTNCTETIPAYLKEQISRLRSVPPPAVAINKAVCETIYDTHRRFFILGWLGGGLKSVDSGLSRMAFAHFIREASEAHQTLQKLMLDKAYAFSGKQYRLCWKLIDFLQELCRLHEGYESHFQDQLFSQFEPFWIPTFEYFEGTGWWGKWTRPYFEMDLADENTRMEVIAEIVKVFPVFDVRDAEMLIQNMRVNPKGKRI